MSRFVAAAVVITAVACGGAQSSEQRAEQGRSEKATGLAIASIEAAVAEREGGVYECRARAAADDLEVEGVVALELIVDDKAVATDVSIVKDTVGDPVLSECLIALWRGAELNGELSAGDKVALPIIEFRSEGAQYLVNATYVSPTAENAAIQLRRLLHEGNTGNDAVEVSMYTVRDGEKVDLSPGPARDGLLYVLSGNGELVGSDGCPSGSGSRVAKPVSEGSGVSMMAAGRVEYRDAAASPGDSVLVLFAPKVAEPSCRPTLIASDGNGVETLSIAGGKGTVSLYFDEGKTGSPSGYLGRFSAQPGVKIPEHVHEGSSEYLLILSGSGQMTVVGASFPVTGGDAIQVPPNTPHSFEVRGQEPVIALQVYSPGGPEQRFRK